MRYVLPALAALALGSATTAASAKSTEVRFHDLDLSTVEGQKSLDRRIDRAARHVCDADVLDTGSLIMSSDAAGCIERAKNGVKRQVAMLVEDATQKGG